jgi:RNA polymerase sigma factor (sigma-70 family)
VSERDLAERVLSGDRHAIDRLVEAAWPRAALGHGGSLPADDLRQEACTELIAAARGYDPARDGDFAALAVARARRCLERLLRADRRRRARLRSIQLDALPAPGDPAVQPGTGPEDGDGNRRLARALSTLSPRLRAVIVRSYGREMSDAEIAAEYGVSPTAIERARRRAAALLRHELRGHRPAP